MISGRALTPTSGTIKLDGQEVQIPTVRAATEHGIALIHQELNLADNLDVVTDVVEQQQRVTEHEH